MGHPRWGSADPARRTGHCQARTARAEAAGARLNRNTVVPHSFLSAGAGSSAAARLAGNSMASIATNATTTALGINTIGSAALTLYTYRSIRRPVHHARTLPAPIPREAA